MYRYILSQWCTCEVSNEVSLNKTKTKLSHPFRQFTFFISYHNAILLFSTFQTRQWILYFKLYFPTILCVISTARRLNEFTHSLRPFHVTCHKGLFSNSCVCVQEFNAHNFVVYLRLIGCKHLSSNYRCSTEELM